MPCLICGKPFLMGVFIGDPDQLCPVCAEEYRNTARVICKTCRVTVMRVEPGRLDNGFQVYPGQVLHLDACNVCKPGIKVSRILEIAEWERLARPSRTFA